ncbi:Ms4527A family Cys-rich leader peptide [Mycobacterium sp. E740]|uniref:Ms4527A family Cys-rich leader peptide n=1 Tax=Mycobacterium sp. E740 TaxID=1834149 RepID=UPI0035160019
MDVDAERPAPRRAHRRQRDHRRAGGVSSGHTASFADPGFAHGERKSPPVRADAGVRGTIDVVSARRIFPKRVSLVARRHVDFKRVCTCCCLP